MTVRKASCKGQASLGDHPPPPAFLTSHTAWFMGLCYPVTNLCVIMNTDSGQKFPSVLREMGRCWCKTVMHDFHISTLRAAAGHSRQNHTGGCWELPDNSFKLSFHCIVLMNAKHHVTPGPSPPSGRGGCGQSICEAAFWSIRSMSQ